MGYLFFQLSHLEEKCDSYYKVNSADPKTNPNTATLFHLNANLLQHYHVIFAV